MIFNLFVIHYDGSENKDRCFYGTGIFSENLGIIDLLKEKNIERESDLFAFLKEYDLKECPIVVNISHCLRNMDRIVLCEIFSKGDIKFKVYNENWSFYGKR